MSDTRQIDYIKEQHGIYANVLNNDNGKKLLKLLEQECYIENSTVQGQIDPYQLAFREGKRSVVLKMKNMSNVDNINKMLNQMEKTQKET